MKALVYCAWIALSVMVMACSEVNPSGPSPVAPGERVGGLAEGAPQLLDGKIAILGLDTEAAWYTLEGSMGFEWLPLPGGEGSDLHLKVEAKLVNTVDEALRAEVDRASTDRVPPERMGRPITKRYHLRSNHGYLDMYLVVLVEEGNLYVLDRWLETAPRTPTGDSDQNTGA